MDKLSEVDLLRLQNFAFRVDLAQRAFVDISREREAFLADLCKRYDLDQTRDQLAADGSIVRSPRES